MAKTKWTVGNVSYLLGVALAVIFAAIGSGLGAAAIYVPALIAVLAIVVAVVNVSAAEGQKFLLWTVAAGVVGFAAFSGAFSGVGLKILEDVVMGIGQYFLFVAVAGVVLMGHKMFSKK